MVQQSHNHILVGTAVVMRVGIVMMSGARVLVVVVLDL